MGQEVSVLCLGSVDEAGEQPRLVDAPTPPCWAGECPTHVGDAGTERQPQLQMVLPVPMLQG